MQLTTDRLILREYTIDDFVSLHSYTKDEDFSKFEAWGPNTEEQTKAFIKDCILKSKKTPRSEFEFAVCIKETGQHIGGAGLRTDAGQSKVANFGYAINPAFQKQGYATESAKALIEFGFSSLKVSVIYATCDVLNIASYTVMEKLGMKHVAIIRNHMTVKGRKRDSFRYEIYPDSSN